MNLIISQQKKQLEAYEKAFIEAESNLNTGQSAQEQELNQFYQNQVKELARRLEV